MRKFITSFIGTFWLIVMLSAVVYAEDVKVNYSVNGASDSKPYGQSYTFSEDTSKTASFNIGAKSGFKIKELYWVDDQGKKLREATGNWKGKDNYTGTDTITGTPIIVKSLASEVFGGIYYWDRSGGSNLWTASAPGVKYTNSSTCPPADTDTWGYKKYPNCTDDGLSNLVTKKGAYVIAGKEGNAAIPDKSVSLSTVKIFDVKIDEEAEMISVHGTYGITDKDTTTYLGTHTALTKSSVRLNFQQTFGQYAIDNNQYKDWASPGARQMWWYHAFSVKFEATTYRYEDKKLIVEWEPKSLDSEMTTINIRHMVRIGSTGSFVKMGETSTVLAEPLPHTRTVPATTGYGKIVGQNVAYTGFSNIVQSGSAATVTLNTSQKAAYVTFFYEVEPPKFTGDFDIVPDTINYRESFQFLPKNFKMNGCTYYSHRYKIERNGTYTTPLETNQGAATSYNYSNYPWIIGIGTHTVSLKITTSCGESDWMAHKTLTVLDMIGNHPPQFKIGFVSPYERTRPLTQVVEGTVLDLIYINDPSVPTPFDPDGDSIEFMGFDTEGSSSSFIQSLPSKYDLYGDGYHHVTMDTIGVHYVSAQMRDQWGLSATATTWIQVVPKNPVPVAKCPAFVTSNRPIPASQFSSSQSFSPVGRSIDHNRDEWTNKKTSYENETDSNIVAKIQLHVYDSTGLKSLSPSECAIIVKPDLPPVAVLEVPALGIRNQTIDIMNRSYSPDDDKIVSVEYKYKYDANNNGFEDDAWQTITGGSLSKFSFRPTKVGKYLFYTKITEDYGKWDDTSKTEVSELILDVINDSPTISFDMEGKNEQPDLEPSDNYSPEEIINNWKLYEVNSATLQTMKEIKWNYEGNILVGTSGKMPEDRTFKGQYRQGISGTYLWFTPFANMGMGSNNISPYRAITNVDSSKMQPLLMPKAAAAGGFEAFEPTSTSYDQVIVWSNESNLYYLAPGESDNSSEHSKYSGKFLYAVDKKKIGRYKGGADLTDPNNGYSVYYKHEWLDGSPYAFIFSPSSLRDAVGAPTEEQYSYYSSDDYYKKDKTRATYMGTKPMTGAHINNVTVTDRTVYQDVKWKCGYNCSYYYDSDGDRRHTDGYRDIRTYDAITGEFISSTLASGIDLPIYNTSIVTSKGDNIVVRNTLTRELLEINRKGELVKKYPEFTRPNFTRVNGSGRTESCTPYQNQLKTGIDAYYYAESVACYYDGYNAPIEVNLIKVNKKDFSVTWSTKLKGTRYNTSETYGHQMGDPSDGYTEVIVNDLNNEVLVNTFDLNGFGYNEYLQTVNMKTGVATTWDPTIKGRFSSNRHEFEFGFDGKTTKIPETKSPRITTAEGWKTSIAENRTVQVVDTTGAVRNSFSTGATLWMNYMFLNATRYGKTGLYVGDGIYLSFSDSAQGGGSTFVPVINIGQPSTDPLVYKAFSLGQFVSTNKLDNAELSFTLAMFQPTINSDLAGMSFRMSNPRNRYAVEVDGKKAYLSKYVNGVRQVLDSKPFISQKEKEDKFVLKFVGDSIKLHINSVPFFDIKDNEYTDGFFGMFSDRSNVDFSTITSKPLAAQDSWSTQYAIWEEADAAAMIRTDNVVFDDPENDPIAKLDWSVYHTVRFINNQGLSSLHGKSFTEGDLKLDKVGDYVVALKGRDDPNPNYLMPSMVFDDYRKDSNEFSRTITVHRRPIANFTVSQRTSDGNVIWVDYSLDPDRYESSTVYSTEDTGIDYKKTKGIMEKRFYYITPSGQYVAEKLVTPQEVGTYEIGMAVKDEYNAWSNYHVEMLDIGKKAVPNTPPKPGFTKSHTSTYRGINVTINSTASDAEDGGRENLIHTYYVRNKTTGGAESVASESRTSWIFKAQDKKVTFDSLGTYIIRQVVEDSKGATAQTEQEITIVNRAPSANVTVPASTNQNVPTKLTELRPEFKWTYSDPDGDAQAKYQLRIYRYGGYLIHDSEVKNGNLLTWRPAVDLPEKTNMYVQVRVYDGHDWGNWSAEKYFYIETNQPPTADFDWSPQPVYEGDNVQFRSMVDDPDGDPLSVQYELISPSGLKSQHSYTLNKPYPATAPKVRLAETGNWMMRMTVNDGKAASIVVTKTIAVRPLAVAGYVKHTELWDQHRQNYNRKKSGQPESPRGYSIFWAGEKFILEADTTATNTLTKAERVEVQFGDFVASLTPVNTAKSNWQGELWDDAFIQLPEGKIGFTFKAFYNNSVIKTTTVEVEIKGQITDIAGVHRVQ